MGEDTKIYIAELGNRDVPKIIDPLSIRVHDQGDVVIIEDLNYMYLCVK